MFENWWIKKNISKSKHILYVNNNVGNGFCKLFWKMF